MSRRGALRLLNDGDLHQRPEVAVDRLLLGVDRLREATQKYRRSSDVLASPGKLMGVIPSVQYVTLDLMGMTSSATRRVTRMWSSVMRWGCRRRWWLDNTAGLTSAPIPACGYSPTGEPFGACLYSGYSTTVGGLFGAAFPCCVHTR